jgi:hypothetical protein
MFVISTYIIITPISARPEVTLSLLWDCSFTSIIITDMALLGHGLCIQSNTYYLLFIPLRSILWYYVL